MIGWYWYDFYDSIIWILWLWFRVQRNPLDFPPIQMPLYRYWYWYRPFLPVCVDTSPKSTAVPCPVHLVLQQISPGTKTDQSHEGTLAEWCLESHYLGNFTSFQESTWCTLQFSIDLKNAHKKSKVCFVVTHTVQSVRIQWSLMMFWCHWEPWTGRSRFQGLLDRLGMPSTMGLDVLQARTGTLQKCLENELTT